MPNQTQTPNGLDPQAVALAQSIRQVESNNNPTAVGKSGEYGAYQWEPATWAKMSAAAGVNTPLQQSTPQEQNQVAYTQIKAWKDAGYNVGQIASMWNAGEGDPNAYLNGNKGTNAQGVAYDTQSYAQKVAQAYQTIKSQGSVQGASTQGQPLSNIGVPTTPGQGNLGQQLIGATEGIFGNKALGNAIGSSLAGPVGAIQPLLQGNPQLALDTFKAGLSSAAQQNTPQNIGEGVIGNTLQDIATPATLAMGGGEGATAVGRIANAGLKFGIGGGLAGAGAAMGQNAPARQVATQGLISGLISAAGGAGGQAVAEGANAIAGSSNFQKILKNISPNMTKSVAQNAFAEGRVIQPESSVLFGTQPDIIDTPTDVFRQGATIARSVPNAGDMTSSQLAVALKNQTGAMAQSLEPQLKQIPISQSITGQIFDNWNTIKAEQQASSDFADFAGSAQQQAKFERYLNQLQWDVQDPITGQMQSPTPKSANDLWNVAINYDDSIPSNIKNATPQQERLYYYKTQWLQNRSILRNALIQIGKDLPVSVGQTFADMHDMFDARQTMIKNYKPVTQGTPGIVQKAAGYTAKQIGAGLGVAAGVGGIGGLVSHLLPQQSSQ